MLGQHRDTYAVPELNLLVGEDGVEALDELPGPRLHGWLRAVAQLYTGEQTLEAIDTARRWIFRRIHHRVEDIYVEILEKVAPLRLIDKSSIYTEPKHAKALERIRKAFPDAHFLHLVRHPRAQCLVWLKSPLALPQLFSLASFDRYRNQTVIDPQLDWQRRQQGILDFLEGVPERQQMRVRSEDLMADPRHHLQAICQWLGLKWSDWTYRGMLHPENSSYSCVGPYGAEAGNNPAFLADPVFRRQARLPIEGELDGHLPWRQDGRPFRPEVVELARQFGYS
ncbi:MAG: sulfotransferase [Pseudomonadota bacterium]|nr:sulfotransferase [Pseudomonadota bacterium]